MLFCQHKFNTWNKLGDDWLNIKDTPHYKFLINDSGEYRRYLELSWKTKPELIDEKIANYKALLEDIRRRGINTPIDVVTRFNGDKMVFHGNHRYAIARYLDIDVPIREVPVDEYLDFNIFNEKYRFGTNAEGIPYQSIFYQGKPIVVGRRQDQIDRHSMIRPDDIIGKRVYDFGCNLGASCILAHEGGASSVEGYDLPEFRTSAIRLAMLLNYDIKYQKHSGVYDTLFLFSVYAHAFFPKDLKAKVIYFETHENKFLPKRFKVKPREFIGKLGKRYLWRIDNSQGDLLI